MLEVRDVHSYYGMAHVLQGVSLEVPEKRVVALLGRNGMGKTTLIRSIMGLSPPTVRGGSVRFQDEELGYYAELLSTAVQRHHLLQDAFTHVSQTRPAVRRSGRAP